MKITWKKTIIATVLLSLAVIASVQAQEETASAATHRSPSPDGAALSFKTPSDGDIVAEVFTVQFGVSGMGIAPAGSDIPNTGHHHLLIDVEELPDLTKPLPATDRIRHFGKGQTETELKLPLGEHSLQLLFADHTHTPHDPPVMSDKITITVSDNPPPPEPEEEDG